MGSATNGSDERPSVVAVGAPTGGMGALTKPVAGLPDALACAKPARRMADNVGYGDEVSGLAIVAALRRTWGNAPTSSGKAVWAAIGPESRL